MKTNMGLGGELSLKGDRKEPPYWAAVAGSWVAFLPWHMCLQVHEPILTLEHAAGLQADFQACYAKLAAAGVPIHVVVPYDDVASETYQVSHARIWGKWIGRPLTHQPAPLPVPARAVADRAACGGAVPGLLWRPRRRLRLPLSPADRALWFPQGGWGRGGCASELWATLTSGCFSFLAFHCGTHPCPAVPKFTLSSTRVRRTRCLVPA